MSDDSDGDDSSKCTHGLSSVADNEVSMLKHLMILSLYSLTLT